LKKALHPPQQKEPRLLLQQWIDQMQASRLPAFDPSAAVNFSFGGNIFGMPNQVMICLQKL
jgi:hypothetical protein